MAKKTSHDLSDEHDPLEISSDTEDIEEGEDEEETARAATSSPDEHKMKRDIAQKAAKTGWKKRNSPPNFRKLGISTLTNLPANIGMVRSFMQAVNWKVAQEEVLDGLSNTVIIVGQPNTGKSTLFNHLKGQQLSKVSPEAGTTKSLIRTDFGPFTLIDTPGHLPDVMETGMAQASLVVFIIDGEKGLQADDRNLLMTIKSLAKPTIIAVNKVDALKSTRAGDDLANEIAMRLGIPGVIPISARLGTNIAEELVPAMIAASPDAALVIGRELPAFRQEAAQRIIRNAALLSLAAGLEPIPLIDIPILIGTQVRLVLRIAALYGEPIDSADALKHARELVVTMISGLGLRYVAEQVAKAVPIGGDIVAGAIAGAATWSIGEVAMQYYESGKTLSPSRVRSLTSSLYKRFRKQKDPAALRSYQIEVTDEPLELEAPTSNEP